MPLSTRFWSYQAERPPDQVGVYELCWADNITYIGSGKIQSRLRDHARDNEKHFHRYRCCITNDRRRAIQIERRELYEFKQQNNRLPAYNSEIPYPP